MNSSIRQISPLSSAASPYTELFSQSVQKLHERGVVLSLQSKWFTSPQTEVNQPNLLCRGETYRWGQLTAPGFATGPFVLLGAGILIAALLALIECSCTAATRQKRSRKRSSNSTANKKAKGQVRRTTSTSSLTTIIYYGKNEKQFVQIPLNLTLDKNQRSSATF